MIWSKIIIEILKKVVKMILKIIYFIITTFFIPFSFEKKNINKRDYQKTKKDKIIHFLWGILGLSVFINLTTIALGVYFTDYIVHYSDDVYVSILMRFIILFICFNLFFYLIKSIELTTKYQHYHYYQKKYSRLIMFKSSIKFFIGCFFLFYSTIIFTYKLEQNQTDAHIQKIKAEKLLVNDIEVNNRTISLLKKAFKSDNNCIVLKTNQYCLETISPNDKNIKNKIAHNSRQFSTLLSHIYSNKSIENKALISEIRYILQSHNRQRKDFREVLDNSNFFNIKVNYVYHTFFFWIVFIINILCLLSSIVLKSVLVYFDSIYRNKISLKMNTLMKNYLQ